MLFLGRDYLATYIWPLVLSHVMPRYLLVSKRPAGEISAVPMPGRKPSEWSSVLPYTLDRLESFQRLVYSPSFGHRGHGIAGISETLVTGHCPLHWGPCLRLKNKRQRLRSQARQKDVNWINKGIWGESASSCASYRLILFVPVTKVFFSQSHSWQVIKNDVWLFCLCMFC